MKVTDPIDVYLADKLFQLDRSDLPPERSTEDDYRAALAGKTMVVFGGSYGIGADIAELAAQYGADVFTFSRSIDQHPRRAPRRHRRAAAAGARRAPAGSTTSSTPPACCRAARWSRPREETIYAATDDQLPRAGARSRRCSTRTCAATGGSLLLFTSSSYTRGRSGYSLYSSAKAAMVNLTQALADEWAGDGVRVNCINPERTGTPMRTKAFGEEPADSLLESEAVARASLDVLVSDFTGHVIDVRREIPTA